MFLFLPSVYLIVFFFRVLRYYSSVLWLSELLLRTPVPFDFWSFPFLSASFLEVLQEVYLPPLATLRKGCSLCPQLKHGVKTLRDMLWFESILITCTEHSVWPFHVKIRVLQFSEIFFKYFIGDFFSPHFSPCFLFKELLLFRSWTSQTFS